MSQQQLAAVLGISQQAINKYENHKIEPDIDTLCKMADFFDTTIDFLVGHNDISPSPEQEDFGSLSETEKQIIIGYRKLNISEKKCIQTLISTYNSPNSL